MKSDEICTVATKYLSGWQDLGKLMASVSCTISKSPFCNLSTDMSRSAKWMCPIAANMSSLWKNNRFFQFPDEFNGEFNPFIETFKATMWDVLRKEPDTKREFDTYMPIRRNGLRIPWYEIYPAAVELDVPTYSEPYEPPLLVDVGGNTGYEAANFKAKNPHIKGRAVVQDLAETFNTSPAAEGVERQVHDCFTPQTIKGEWAHKAIAWPNSSY